MMAAFSMPDVMAGHGTVGIIGCQRVGSQGGVLSHYRPRRHNKLNKTQK